VTEDVQRLGLCVVNGMTGTGLKLWVEKTLVKSVINIFDEEIVGAAMVELVIEGDVYKSEVGFLTAGIWLVILVVVFSALSKLKLVAEVKVDEFGSKNLVGNMKLSTVVDKIIEEFINELWVDDNVIESTLEVDCEDVIESLLNIVVK